MIKFLFFIIIIVCVLLFIINNNNNLNSNIIKYDDVKKLKQSITDDQTLMMGKNFSVIKKSKHIINEFKINFIYKY